jgi:hypothetical protein
MENAPVTDQVLQISQKRWRADAHYWQDIFVTGIKQQPLLQLSTGHVKWVFLWAHGELS